MKCAWRSNEETTSSPDKPEETAAVTEERRGRNSGTSTGKSNVPGCTEVTLEGVSIGRGDLTSSVGKANIPGGRRGTTHRESEWKSMMVK